MINQGNNNLIVVLGLGPAGLFVARQLYKINKRVIGIGKSDDIGRYSKCLEKLYIADDAKDLFTAVQKIIISNTITPQGLICSDAYLTYIIEKYPQIFKMLDFIYPNEQILELMYDKQALSDMLKNINVRTPQIFSELHNIVYPVVVKPIIKRRKSPIPKISFIDNEAQLDSLLIVATEGGLKKEDLIIQQRITGDNSTEFGYGGYFEKGTIVNDTAFIQGRQYPQGVSCTAIEIDDPNRLRYFRELTNPIISELNYSGFIQFDIKMDSVTKDYYIIDINPRPWGSISIMRPKGRNKNGNIFIRGEKQGRNALWHFPLKEIVSFRNKNNIPYSKCRLLASSNTVTLIDLWDRSDIKPFLMQPIVMFRKLFG